jgi:hypothetical protein
MTSQERPTNSHSGIYQTVQLRFSRLSLCVDTATTPFWTPDLTLIDCVCALAGERSPRNLEQRFLSNPGQFFQACGMLLGCYFNVRHLSAARNAKKMKFLSWSGQDAFSTTFDERLDDDSTQSISVADYFHRKYNIKLLYPSLPLAHTRDGDMPLELCYTASGMFLCRLKARSILTHHRRKVQRYLARTSHLRFHKVRDHFRVYTATANQCKLAELSMASKSNGPGSWLIRRPKDDAGACSKFLNFAFPCAT